MAPTFLHLMSTMKNIQKNILVAAQNCSLTSYGAFTGEVSAEALVDLGLKWVILGHSERRSLYEESNETVAKKSLAAIKAGLSVIFCVGEKLEERNAEQTFQVLSKQLSALSGNSIMPPFAKCILLYLYHLFLKTNCLRLTGKRLLWLMSQYGPSVLV